jgi:hypothetical protein
MLQEPNNDLTVVADRRRLLFGSCTFEVENVPIRDGGTPIHVTEVTLDHIEVAVHQDDSCVVPNTKQPESSWHRVSGATCQL